ncbi:MAG: Mur ligase family protein, partial [Dehalococcoidia bacterium]
GPVHLGRLGSMEEITAAKGELVESLPPDGVAVLNGDDPQVASLTRSTRARVMLYGTSDRCDLRASEVTGHGLAGISFRLTYGEESAPVSMPPPGLSGPGRRRCGRKLWPPPGGGGAGSGPGDAAPAPATAAGDQRQHHPGRQL